jgi:DNA-binding NarL/FixJ family response regulator
VISVVIVLSFANPYAKSKVLIIEDQAQMRTSMRAMLTRFGYTDIDAFPNGDEGVHSMRFKPYQIVFCDYDMGSGKDGQQVLEEARFGKLLKPSSVFIMVTAAQTVEMVMGALEFEPDGYITKPLTYDVLKQRLIRILKTKELFAPINAELDKGHIDAALFECDRLVAMQPKAALSCYRIKCRSLFQQQKYAEADACIDRAMEIRVIPWVLLYKAKALYYLKSYAKAKQLLEGIISGNEKFIEAYDWLARVHVSLDNKMEAQKVLEQAVTQSPRAVELGKLAMENESYGVANSAFRKSVALGKNSCHKSPDNYLNLVKSLQANLVAGTPREKRYATHEAVSILNTVKKEYNDDKKIHVQANLLEGETLFNSGKETQARSVLIKAKELYEGLDASKPFELGKELMITLVAYGDAAQGGALKEHIKQAFQLDEAAAHALDQAAEDASRLKLSKRIDYINNKAVDLFEKGEYRDALHQFNIAASDPDANHSIVLNAAQAYIKYLCDVKFDQDVYDKVMDCFERLKDLPENDRRHTRLNKLQMMFNELNQKKTASNE